MVAGISVHAYHFFWLAQTWPVPWGYRNRCFMAPLCHLIVRRSNLEVAIMRLLHQQVKISAIMCIEVCRNSNFQCCGYFWGHWVPFVTTDEYSLRVSQITWRIGVSWTYSLPFCFRHIFNLMKWPFYQNNVKQISLNHTTPWNLTSPIFEVFFQILLNVNISLNQGLLTNLDDLTDSGNFSLEGYFTLVWKDSVTHMLGLAVYVKEHLPFVREVSLENSADSYLFLTDFTSHSV